MSFQNFQDGHHWNTTNLAILNFQVAQCSFRLTVREQTWFEDFQDGHHSGDLGHRNGMMFASLNFHVAPMPQSSFSSIRLTVWEEMSFEDFQDGRHGDHLGYWNGMILTILNVYVAPMSSAKFGLNLT